MDVLLIVMLLLLNGLLAASEIAVVSSAKARLRQRATEGGRGAAAALALSDSPTRFLSTVQVGITLVGILLGAVGEDALSVRLETALKATPLPEAFVTPIAFAAVILSITFLSVVIGELVPKRLAMSAPEAIASWIAVPMLLLSKIAAPFVAILSFTTDQILRLFGARDSDLDPVTSHEINLMIEEGAKAGEFTPEEQRLVERVLHLGDQRVEAVMVHRTEMQWLDAQWPVERARRVAKESDQNYFAVCRKSVDKIVGAVGVRDLLPGDAPAGTGVPGAGGAAAGADLRSIAKPPLFVPESAPALRVLERLRAAKVPIAFVVDEYGAVQGQVTIRDILDKLVGRVFRAEVGQG
jgi:putative hemolysin